VRSGDGIGKMHLLQPAERVQIAVPNQDPFVPLGKYYREGWYDRPDIFVCEVPNAHYHVPSGLVCTGNFKAIVDFGLEDRLTNYTALYGRRPLFVKKLRGVYSSVHSCFIDNLWHWMLDSLPRIHSLEKVAPKTGLTLLMPAGSNKYVRETLRCILPDHFKVEYVSDPEWLKTELFLWPSLVSGRCMGLLPREYYDAIRSRMFKKYDLPRQHTKKERLYISRAGAGHRRVLNEDAVMQLLGKFGFRKVTLQEMSFREQVELLHRAEFVIGPHGSGFGGTFFSGDIDVVVLYSTRIPPNYFHTLALGLGQRHHFVCHDMKWEDDDFAADLPALERVLKDELKLKPSA